MAFQTTALLVISKGNTAVLTLDSRSARAADHKPRISAAIDEDQRLRSFRETLRDRAAELRGKRTGPMRGSEILAKVHDFHRSHGAVFHARVQLQKAILTGACVMKTL